MSGTPAGGTDASRTRDFLTPTSEDSLNYGHGRRRIDGKRTESGAMEELLRPSVAVKPHPPQLRVQPRLLLPLMLLPREHLSLACIDLGASDRDLPPSRLFESRVKMLDLESRLGAKPSILVARNETRGTVHVLERQGCNEGLYTMCQLGSWVDLAALAAKATAVAWERLRPSTRHISGGAGDVISTTPCLSKEQKRKRAAIEAVQSLVKKRMRSQSVSTFDDTAAVGRQVLAQVDGNGSHLSPPHSEQQEPTLVAIAPVASLVPELDAPASLTPPITAEAIFDSIRSQYSEALYKSMGSLAYFVKGPLSRARSAFHVDLESSLDMADLIEFLRSLILTTVQIDKKYRDTIPDLISKTKIGLESSDENSKKRRRRARKMKLGKSGLYPHEDESIRKWWASKQPEPSNDQSSNSTTTPQLKPHLSLLRTRETQLQIIVALEILALEPVKAAAEAGEDSLPRLPGAELTEEQTSPQKKKRSKHNLPVLIDVHADRLTIWQSTTTDEQLLLEDSQVTRGQLHGQSQQRTSSEPLKDFCVDIIVPFFSARLPKLCDAINRKLGGPLILSPLTSKSSRRAPSKREQKPGTAIKRPAPMSRQRTLQRALSTEQQHRRSVSRGPGSAIALMRSATTTSMVSVKREGSEPAALMRALPSAKGEGTKPATWKRPPLSHSSSAPSLAAGSKASQKALVEAELKDAISALRKPNRDVVGKAMAEADERRVLASQSAKKAKKAPRASVVVKATPANNRFRDVIAPPGHRPSDDVVLASTEDLVPRSSDGVRLVPSTGHGPGHKDAFATVGASSPAPDLVVGSTPMKPPARSCFIRRPASEALPVPAAPPSSPLAEARRKKKVDSVCSVGRQADIGSSRSRSEQVAATPVRRIAPRPDPSGSPTPAVAAHVSIYRRLGWDDDDIDDLS
ncbi:hypothetical protein XA68_10158 [Ophiocordyceps unilateralis]|uniref:DNA replication regulator Sld3 C-terminal domain-containing protein n=1 Tax=Ophiocordyceps unilateralis TaxID=268505 RepID=A0A2A9P2X0_OPHUN|nr:hypothetical protein XA68_10158 [Ophiocordyceps unilateralis]